MTEKGVPQRPKANCRAGKITRLRGLAPAPPVPRVPRLFGLQRLGRLRRQLGLRRWPAAEARADEQHRH